jgi:hypothetical protein
MAIARDNQDIMRIKQNPEVRTNHGHPIYETIITDARISSRNKLKVCSVMQSVLLLYVPLLIISLSLNQLL